jgi:hypothetical protein
MSRRIENNRRSSHSIFLPQNYGSPFNDMDERIADLGPARLYSSAARPQERRFTPSRAI